MQERDERAGQGLEPWTPAAREVPPPRPLPRQREHRELPPESGAGSDAAGPPSTRRPAEDEPTWRRERREEAEFRAEFGEWRAGGGAPRPSSGGFLGGVTISAPLLVLIAVLVAVFALALHL